MKRHYWKVMQYTCNRCGHWVDFFLEDGCEGPRDRKAPFPPQWESALTRALGAHPGTVDQTASGRYVLPVPFMAGACRKCQPGGPPYSLRGGVMQHVDWPRDRNVDVTERVPLDAGCFHYPRDWWADQACGEPVFPGEAPRSLEATSKRHRSDTTRPGGAHTEEGR